MRRFLKVALVSILLNTALLLIVSPSVRAASINELKDKRDTLSREIDRNKKEAEAKKAEANKLSGEIKKIDGDIGVTENKIDKTATSIDQTEKNIDQLTKEVASKEADLVVEVSNQKEAIRIIYETTEQNPTYLLAGSSISEAVDRASYLESLEIKIESTIEQITLLKNQLVKEKSDLTNKQKHLESLKNQQEAYKNGLEEQKENKDRMLGQTKAAQAEFEKKLADAKKMSVQVDAEISALARAAKSGGGRIKSKDRGTSAVGFIWPMDSDYTTTEFGPTDRSYPFFSAISYHYGLDIVNRSCGAPVYAAADGVVNTFSSGSGYGNYIIVGHNARYSTLYGHLMGFATTDGQEVKQGQVIGYEGTTGWSTGCHVHFEVWDNGSRVNPRAVLP